MPYATCDSASCPAARARTNQPVLGDLAACWLRTWRLMDEHVKMIATRRIAEHRDKRDRACC
jgi:hypothetical protein